MDPSISSHPRRSKQSKVTDKRTSKACDQCRKTKTKCESAADPCMPCRSCILAGYDCTFNTPSQKRGPPKGYLSALENRLHQAEALLGALIMTTDQRAKSLLSDLKRDPQAEEILTRITNGVFGPTGRVSSKSRLGPPSASELTPSRRQRMNSREVALSSQSDSDSEVKSDKRFLTPSNAWQDHLCKNVLSRDPWISTNPPSNGALTCASPCSSSGSCFPELSSTPHDSPKSIFEDLLTTDPQELKSPLLLFNEPATSKEDFSVNPWSIPPGFVPTKDVSISMTEWVRGPYLSSESTPLTSFLDDDFTFRF